MSGMAGEMFGMNPSNRRIRCLEFLLFAVLHASIPGWHVDVALYQLTVRVREMRWI